MTKADDAVKRVDEFFAGFIPNEKIFNHGPLPGDRSSLNVEDIRTILAELEKLRKLDAEYGRVESAIIMADQAFDGDSDHDNCGDRLIVSVERLSEKAKSQAAEIERLRGALKDQVVGWKEVLKLDVLAERETWGAQETLKSAEQALKGEA